MFHSCSDNCRVPNAVKGIVSRDGVSTETIGVKFRPKQPTAYVSYTWKVARTSEKRGESMKLYHFKSLQLGR
jgi:hypothetical protein